MKLRIFIPILWVAFTYTAQGQETDLSITAISPELFENANAVLRKEEVIIEIHSVDKLIQKKKRIVTVLNDQGNNKVAAGQFYNSSIKIKNQEAIIYNGAGEQIKKVKQKDFKDVSAVGSNDLYTDSRVQYLDYTPQSYPYTVVYESEIQNNSTVFIFPWEPVEGYLMSIQNSSYVFSNPKGIPFRLEESNFEGFEVKEEKSQTGFSYSISNIPAYKREYLSPALEEFVPKVEVALNEFSLVGITGTASNWQEFGKWQYDNLLAGRNELPVQTIQKVKELTANATTDIEKARLIYQYVQDNTRYISVQLGIGGWEPMFAEEVDKLGYGDCKALTNYTKALLDSQGIPSYYAVINAGEERKDMQEDFASMQGNHVILNIPQKEGDVWLECTSQTDPFGYLGDWTDNRNVLLLKPEGGEIVKTKAYSVSENVQETFCDISLEESGNFNAQVKRSSKGIPYGNIYHLARETEEKQTLYYKNSWSHLQNLRVSNISFTNNRENHEFLEEIALAGDNFVTKAGSRILVPLNFLIPGTYSVPRSNSRSFPFEILRGGTYKDTFVISLPPHYDIESMPQAVNIESEFGTFNLKIEPGENENKRFLEVVREYTINQGRWSPDKYNSFRDFMIQVNTQSNQKAVLVTTT